MKQVYFNGLGASGAGNGGGASGAAGGYNTTPATHNGMGQQQAKNRVGGRGLQQHPVRATFKSFMLKASGNRLIKYSL